MSRACFSYVMKYGVHVEHDRFDPHTLFQVLCYDRRIKPTRAEPEADMVGHATLCAPLPGRLLAYSQEELPDFVKAPFVLEHVFVWPSHRGLRLGHDLVRLCTSYAARRQIPVVVTPKQYDGKVCASPRALVNFYEACGFKPVDVEEDGTVHMVWQP